MKLRESIVCDTLPAIKRKRGKVMNKVEKVLTEKGILYEADDYQCSKGAEYDWCRRLVDITDDFIITVMYSAVLDEALYIYDRRTFELVAEQSLFPEYTFFGEKSKNPWGVAAVLM